MAKSFQLFFQAVYERALKAICFSLQFYYLEVLNQDGTLSCATAMTSLCQGVICHLKLVDYQELTPLQWE